MRKMKLLVFGLVIFLSFSVVVKAAPLFDIPRLTDIEIDGDEADWKDLGFCVDIMTSKEGELRPPEDFDPTFRLGWDDRGLVVLVKVRDDVAVENPVDELIWQNDSIEMFIGEKRGSAEYWQVIVSPGLDEKYPKDRLYFFEHRKTRQPEKLSASVVRKKIEGGYIVEAILPWENLRIDPKEGLEVGFQLYVNDTDRVEDGDRFSANWYPDNGTYSDPNLMHRVRLAKEPSPPVQAHATGQFPPERHSRINVVAVKALVGKTVEVKADGRTLASRQLKEKWGRASASLLVPGTLMGRTYNRLSVFVDGNPVRDFEISAGPADFAKRLVFSEVHFEPFVFSGEDFPLCDFERPFFVEGIIGPYQIETTFYDKDFKEVTLAKEPGRYGAIVQIIPEKGRATYRYCTLFRQPKELWWWRKEVKASIELPGELGIDPRVLAENSDAISEHLKWRFVDGLSRDLYGAKLLAGLYEAEAGRGPVSAANDVFARDRQWWVTLKRKMYGFDKQYDKSFVCPHSIDGEPAPVLREGPAAEAGMKDDAVKKIDEVCKAWAADSDEAFAVCIARHGVVFFHKAYGERDGEPMTVTTQSWMASITKLMSGTLMMTLVDQDLVDLDDAVDKFLPALRGIKVETPLTIRHLYTHTSGFWDHWGDEMDDLEEVVAGYYPHLEVGKAHQYNGVGYALGGKVIEMISGEAIPRFYEKHLLGPLGCSKTRVTGTMGDAVSVPMDIAKIGQMLLNKGAYGNMRFFSVETFEKMLPEKLTKILGPDTDISWGIGLTWFGDEGLGEGTFGHGAASAATLRIDPVNDLVIVMTRNAGGKNFHKYHPEFIEAIVAGLSDAGSDAAKK